jgi:hypothetical protein
MTAILVLSFCIGIGIFIFQWSVSRVKSSALKLAGDTPYCIQIPGEAGYEEVRSTGNLSIFRMRAAHGNHHAVLMMKNGSTVERFHWSYWNGAFVPGAIGSPAIYCIPRHGFLAAIERSPLPKPATFKFTLDGAAFSIPFSFRPMVIESDAALSITFFASVPDFGPLENPPEYNRAVPARDILSFVEARFGSRSDLSTSLLKNSSTDKVEDAAEEYGLQKQFTWYLPGNSTAALQYSAKSRNGDVNTVIRCPGSKLGSCLHVFRKDGWTYSFNHREAEIPHWEAMQEKLVSVINSFKARNQNAH